MVVIFSTHRQAYGGDLYPKGFIMTIDIVALIIGFVLGGACCASFFLIRQNKSERQKALLQHELQTLSETFDSLAQESLRKSSESFLQLAQEKLASAQKDSAHDMDKRSQAIVELVKPVQQKLEQLHGAMEQMKSTDQSLRQDLRDLSRETSKLSGALRNPASRGNWGEYILEKLLDQANLIKGIHYDTQVSMESDAGRLRPDAVIKLQDGFNVIVDAKAPITHVMKRLDEDLSETDFKDIQGDLAKTVREHVKQLGHKEYWAQLDSPDFVVLFLPSEHLFSTALRGDPELVDFAAEKQVIIASPVLMMSLLRVIGMSWRQVEMAKSAQEISNIGVDLYKRLSTFSNHLQKIGNSLNTAVNAYNSTVGSLERNVLPGARKFEKLQVKSGELENLKIIDAQAKTPMLESVADTENTETKAVVSTNKK